jgi:tyrosyl-DNA phosphodiesterase-1
MYVESKTRQGHKPMPSTQIWFIQDLRPQVDASSCKHAESDFESILLEHVEALACPQQFLEQVRGKYDYSLVRARIVTSQPGAYKGADAERYGQLRLRRVIQDLGFKESQIDLESCTGSIGGLEPLWLHRFFDSFSGKRQNAKLTAVTRLPPVKIIYPTRADVLDSLFRELARGMSDSDAVKYIEEQASNIGSHLRWKNASDEQKRLYHHFLSKDPKKPLFHMKLLLAFPRGQPTVRPLYIYTGSANLSASAWGKAEHDKKAETAGEMRVSGISNFECGVVIKGEDLESMLAEGTWEEVVPFRRPAKAYQLSGSGAEKPWNSPAWVQKR